MIVNDRFNECLKGLRQRLITSPLKNESVTPRLVAGTPRARRGLSEGTVAERPLRGDKAYTTP
jgi:hypothetical protein